MSYCKKKKTRKYNYLLNVGRKKIKRKDRTIKNLKKDVISYYFYRLNGLKI